MDSEEFTRQALRVSYISLGVNALLTLGKLLAGIFGHSMAMVADAIHSASDVFSTLIVMVAVVIAGKPEDEDHEYGHERFESVAAIILAVILAGTGLEIGRSGLESIVQGAYLEAAIPELSALIMAVASIVIKEWMYLYTKRIGRRIGSDALIADAYHHRSDSLSSIGSFIGIGAARLGLPIMDPLASLVICLFILHSAWEIFSEAQRKLTDHAMDPETVAKIRRLVGQTPGVKALDELKTREFGTRCYVDCEIGVDSSLSLVEAHEIAESVHEGIEKSFPMVKHCTVHVNPYLSGERGKSGQESEEEH